MSEMKYVVYSKVLLLFAVLFPDIIPHQQIAELTQGKILSAGFFRLEGDKVKCFGGSTSLNLLSVPERDERIIMKELTGMTYLREIEVE